MNLASDDSPCRWVWRGCLQQLVLGRLDCSTLKCGTRVCEQACMVRASRCCGLAAPPPCINRSPGFNGVSLSPACRFLFGNLFNDGLGPLVLLSYPCIISYHIPGLGRAAQPNKQKGDVIFNRRPFEIPKDMGSPLMHGADAAIIQTYNASWSANSGPKRQCKQTDHSLARLSCLCLAPGPAIWSARYITTQFSTNSTSNLVWRTRMHPQHWVGEPV